jgi:NADPH2:quinone reductase
MRTDARPLAVLVERFEGPAALVLREVDILEPGAGELLIEVHAAGVNYPDLLVSHGTYQDLYPLPFVIGKEGAGVVRALGPNPCRFALGDRVAFQVDAGAFSEQVIVPANQCYPVPPDVPLLDAAAMVLAYQTAYFALTDRAGLRPGEWLLVLGASGGVGVAALELGRALGARVVAGIHDASKEEFVRSHGAEFVEYLTSTELGQALRSRINQLSAGHGMDVVLDTVGGAAFDAALRVLARGGRLAVVGFTSGSIPSARANYLLLKHISVMGVNWGVYRDGDPSRVVEVQARIFDWLSRGVLRSAVTQVRPMADVALALTDLERRKTKGKLVLTTKYAV